MGSDVHQDSIAIAVAQPRGEAKIFKQIPNELDFVLKELRQLGKDCELKVCDESGPLVPCQGLIRGCVMTKAPGVAGFAS